MTKEIDPNTVDLLHQNMKCRLFDIVGEYLDDDNYSSVTFFTDLMDALKDWKDYHHKKLEKVNLAMSLITGDTPSPSLSDRSIIQFNTNYTEEELNAMCDKAASDQEKEKCREYNLREAEYYNQRFKVDVATTKADWDEFWEHK